MVVNGAATRKVSAVVEELCGVELSPSTASDLCQHLDAVVKGRLPSFSSAIRRITYNPVNFCNPSHVFGSVIRNYQ